MKNYVSTATNKTGKHLRELHMALPGSHPTVRVSAHLSTSVNILCMLRVHTMPDSTLGALYALSAATAAGAVMSTSSVSMLVEAGRAGGAGLLPVSVIAASAAAGSSALCWYTASMSSWVVKGGWGTGWC